MKKMIIVIGICISLNTAINANISTQFMKKIAKMTKGKVDDVVKYIPSKTGLNKTLTKNIDAPKLKSIIAKDPNKVFLANKADEIVSKGAFEKNFFNNLNFDSQLSVIAQSSRYGDEYFSVAQKVVKTAPNIFRNNSKLATILPSSKINQKILQEKFVETLKKTGKHGWERLKDISAWAIKHPKISGASGAVAWYALNPSSFEEALKESGQMLGEFLVTILATTTSGVGSGIANKGKEMVENTINDFKDDATSKLGNSTPYILNLILGVMFFVGAFFAWRKRKVIHHFITKADEVKNNIEKKDNEF